MEALAIAQGPSLYVALISVQACFADKIWNSAAMPTRADKSLM